MTMCMNVHKALKHVNQVPNLASRQFQAPTYQAPIHLPCNALIYRYGPGMTVVLSGRVNCRKQRPTLAGYAQQKLRNERKVIRRLNFVGQPADRRQFLGRHETIRRQQPQRSLHYARTLFRHPRVLARRPPLHRVKNVVHRAARSLMMSRHFRDPSLLRVLVRRNEVESVADAARAFHCLRRRVFRHRVGVRRLPRRSRVVVARAL